MPHGLLEGIRSNFNYKKTAGWKAIDGKNEAVLYPRLSQETNGDEKFLGALAERAAIGTNKNCPAGTGSTCAARKNDWGAMHFGIGHGADRHQMNSKLRLEGIVDRVTVVVDDKVVVCDKGQIKV